MIADGFRAMASTSLNEQGWPPDVIELQLAHMERNKVRAAYNRASRLAERRRMMQAWADYLRVQPGAICRVASRQWPRSSILRRVAGAGHGWPINIHPLRTRGRRRF